jgi:hypothetical protein
MTARKFTPLFVLFSLLEEPCDLDAALVQASNVVKDDPGDVNVAAGASRAQIHHLSSSLMASSLNGDPGAAMTAAFPLRRVQSNDRIALVVGPAAGAETLEASQS